MAHRHLAQIPMRLLRIRCSLGEPPQRCEWALIGADRQSAPGEGRLAELPRGAERVQLVLPAAEVAITRTRLPPAARRRAGSVLAYAVEEETLGQPEANQVSWLGTAGGADLLAVWDRQGLKRWVDALGGIGINAYEVHWETFLLPWAAGEWSLAWNGREGFVRSGEFEGAATDCGDRESPPMSLRLLLDEARKSGAAPASIALYAAAPDCAPDMDAWQRALGVSAWVAGQWDWRTAPADAGVALMQERRRWRVAPGLLARLRPAVWIAGAALAIHALALAADWTMLAGEQRQLRRQMETRFRAAFPDAVAVVDPALQMRRKLTEVRHGAGQPDSGDFLPMIDKVSAGMKELPPGNLRVVSFESGRMTLELGMLDETLVRRVVARLVQSGLKVEVGSGKGGAVPPGPGRAGSGAVVMTVTAS
ncbi:MAG: general secretion pathway protein GspL [Betaproteobacteria bacterium]|nr:general secretion pathway protein GspL [Betaproteobacteria bacterium]